MESPQVCLHGDDTSAQGKKTALAKMWNGDAIPDRWQSLMSRAGKQSNYYRENKTHATVLDIALSTRKKHPRTGVATILFLCSCPLPKTYCPIFTSFYSLFVLLIPVLLTQDGWHGGDCC